MVSDGEKEAEAAIAARDYQIEIFEEACKQNVIVCLGTGTGKTFISVMLIKELAHQIRGKLQDGGKRTFFLVTTVPLVYQQSKVIESQTGLKVGKYTGDMNVDAWDMGTWRDEFNKHEVLVMTHQILLNNILHGYIRPSNINLLILDECHHTGKNHPYKRIMSKLEESVNRPRVMGLTASIINEKVRKRGALLQHYLEERMRTLEANLRAVCFTCADQASILPYATKPEESIEEHRPLYYDSDPEINAVSQLMQGAFGDVIPEQPTNRSDKQSYERYENIVKDLSEILFSLGIWCTYKAAIDFRNNLGNDSNLGRYRTYSMTVINQIIKVFEEYARREFMEVENVTLMEPMIAPKILALMDLLVENRRNGDLCCIVFVQRRVTSKVLSDLINRLVHDFDHYSGIKSEFVHGHSLIEILRGSDSGGMTSSKQERVLKRFREGEFNVLVATSVVEEGLDVRKCNLVVRFDGVDNYRQYVQSKGRARAEDSKFIVLAEHSMVPEVSSDLEGMREVEEFLIEKCRGRELPTDEEIEALRLHGELITPYRISDEEGAAQISQDNAVQLIYMYCSQLPSDRFTQLMPTFKFRNELGDCTAIVTLPLNSPLREDVSGEPMPSKTLARISAAQKACIRLHEIGELNDNFVPISHSDASEDEEDSDDDADDDSNIIGDHGAKLPKHVYKRKIPDCFLTDGQFPSAGLYLYALELSLVRPEETIPGLWKAWYEEERSSFGLLTTKRLPEVGCFSLYAKAGTVDVHIKLLETELSLDASELKEAAMFHEKMFEGYIQKLDPQCQLSLTNAISKAMLVAVRDSCTNVSKRRKECLIDLAFMQKVCTDAIRPRSGEVNYEDSIVRKTYADTSSLFYVTAVRDDLKVSDRIASNQVTFKEYYKSKYGKNIGYDQPLLESVQVSSRMNLISPRYKEKSGRENDLLRSRSGALHLVPELCEQLNMPASFHCQLVCIPSLLFKLETILAAEELRQNMMKEMNIGTLGDTSDYEQIMNEDAEMDGVYGKMKSFLKGKSSLNSCTIKPQLILQSLTTSKAHAGFDLERLETLGDSFLKMATSIFLYFSQPNRNEGRLTDKRKRLISNKKLMKLATGKKVQQYMCNTEFGLKPQSNEGDDNTLWVPPMFIKRGKDQVDTIVKPCQIIRDKSIADCVEALIGAFFEHGGIDGALKIMQWFGISCFYQDVGTAVDPRQASGTYADFIPPATALFIETPESLRFVEEHYEKCRLRVLERTINYKFKEKSFLIQAFTHMSYYQNRSTDCYQRLEFLGDALLDFLIIAHLYACDTKLDPGNLTKLKSALVNNNTFALLAVRHKLQKYLMYFQQDLHSALQQFVDLDEKEIDMQLKNPFIITFNNNEQEGFHAPKLLGDIFESLAGAIFLDSGLDLVQVWKVFYPIMKPLIDQYMRDMPIHPVAELNELSPTASASCEKMEDGKIMCTWDVNGQSFQGIGQNKHMAKAAAALNALSKLKI